MFINYIEIGIHSLFYKRFLYFDVSEFLADRIFINHKIPVKFEGDFSKEGTNYCCVLCKVRKRYVKEFLLALDELGPKMLLLGYKDYEDFCAEMQEKLKEE